VTRLAVWWSTLRESYWFVPTMLLVGAIGLAVATIETDRTFGVGWLPTAALVYGGGAEGARSLLSTVASSMITVAGVVFSITIVALTLASNQFGPRLLRNYMSDLGNQITLGTFVATFLYCLIVARTVRSGDGAFVPQISVTVAILLAIASLAVLIFYIHHISQMIQPANVIAAVGAELDRVIDDVYPPPGDDTADEPPDDVSAPADAVVVPAPERGYVQAIDCPALVRAAARHDVAIEVLPAIGEYVLAGQALARVWPARRAGDDVARAVRSACVLGQRQTRAQDVGFAVEQLVQIAVRALSPAMNDPFTAMASIDRLGAGLLHVARRPPPPRARRDERGRVRVLARTATFVDLADRAFTALRPAGRESVLVARHLLATIGQIAGGVRRPAERRALHAHADRIACDASRAIDDADDCRSVQRAHDEAVAALRAASAAGADARPGPVAEWG
jgi:uncharacterized membrane protein